MPTSRYHVSPRSRPAQLPPPTFDLDDQVRKVQAGGWVFFQRRQPRHSTELRGQSVAVRQRPTDIGWAIPLLIEYMGTLDLREPASLCVACL